jgi:DNA (cytosine-5)-methyltransferase 1
MPTIGSLCTGIGGLDLAVERHFGADLLWYSDIDPKANEVMAAHRPDALALGDFTAVDPATVEVPDILTAGFPCQPVSSAGKQKGTADERWLFNDIITFIEGLRSLPTWVVLENVRNLLSHDSGRTALEVFRQVAGLGFDIDYGVVRASEAGMPHQRARVFIVATHPDCLSEEGSPRCAQPPGRSLAGADGEAPTHPDGPGGEAREHPGRSRERLRLESLGCATPPTHPPRPERRDPQHEPLGEAGRPTSEPGERLGPSGWGDFWPAIERWESLFGPAPHPADDGRINPRFVEWMCGHEAGLVTDVIPQRTHALRLLGNSVCPPQAELALALLT